MIIPAIHMPLASAYLCVECDHVTNSATQCPCCASQHGLASLGAILDRKQSDSVPAFLYATVPALLCAAVETPEHAYA